MRKRDNSPLFTIMCIGSIVGAHVLSAQVCSSTVFGNYSYAALGNGLPGSLASGMTSTGTSGSGSGDDPAFGSGPDVVPHLVVETVEKLLVEPQAHARRSSGRSGDFTTLGPVRNHPDGGRVGKPRKEREFRSPSKVCIRLAVRMAPPQV